MKELDEMHALKNDQQKLLELKKKVEQKVIEETQTVKPRRRHPVPLRLPKNAKIVNRMLLKRLTVPTIAYCLDIPERSVMKYMADHKLPRSLT